MCKRNRKPLQLRKFLPLLVLVIAGSLICTAINLPAQALSQELSVSASFTNTTSVAPSEKISLHLNRSLQSSEGRIAIFVGATDMTALFAAQESAFNYAANLPLPVGENDLLVYQISIENQWREIARFPLRVAQAVQDLSQPTSPSADKGQNNGSNGSKTTLFTPTLTLGLKSQPAEAHFPESNRPERQRFADFTLQGSLATQATNGRFGFQSQLDVAGSSYRNEALRFSQQGEAAPQIDLASYLMQFQAGKAKVQVGHIAFGANRHLINSFSSRGISITVPVTPRGDFSMAAMNGTSIVGWSNFVGLNRRKHQIFTGRLGFELLPKRPGALRVEGAALHGSLLPISNFNQGNITDAEQSKGLSFRLVASDAAQRLRLDAGYARSRFDNPTDFLLNQNFDTVSVGQATRDALYLDANYVLVRDLKLSETRRANLTLNYRLETIDPLFRSVAAFNQADRFQNQLELVANIADLTLTAGHLRFNDNLDDIPSILKTLTRRTGVIIGAPLVSLFSNPAKPNLWLPRLSYGFDRTHQYGTGLPINSGFNSASQIPDQLSANQTAMAEWQAKQLRFGYRFNHSLQDNRQLGRERADLRNLINGFTVGLTPSNALDLSLDLSLESAKNLETSRTDRTHRLGTNLNWRMSAKTALAAMVSTMFAGDLAQTSKSRNLELDLQWSYRFSVERSRYRKVQGQFFIRYANRYARLFDNTFDLRNRTRLQTLNTGLSFTFF
jgi:hypothetical protein